MFLVVSFFWEKQVSNSPFAHLEIHTLISLSLSPQKTYSPQGEKETWPGRVRWIQYKYLVRLNHAKFSVIWFVILTSNILQWLHSMKQTTCPHQMISSKKPTILKAFPAISINATAGNAPAGHKESHFRCDAQHFWRDLQSLVATTIPNQSRKRLFFLLLALSAFFLEYTNESYVSKTLPRITFPSFSEQTTKKTTDTETNFTKTQKYTWDLRTFTQKIAPYSHQQKKKQLHKSFPIPGKELSASQMTKSWS